MGGPVSGWAGGMARRHSGRCRGGSCASIGCQSAAQTCAWPASLEHAFHLQTAAPSITVKIEYKAAQTKLPGSLERVHHFLGLM